jgi:hypothetical protein
LDLERVDDVAVGQVADQLVAKADGLDLLHDRSLWS